MQLNTKHSKLNTEGMADKTLVILISGRGSNLAALFAAQLPARVAAVISNNPRARGLDIARERGIAASTIDHRSFADRAAFEAALAVEVDRHRPDLVVLAGFMRILTPSFIERYLGRIMNIHPSLLPAFPGLHTHRRALAAGVRIHGCTVHFVTPELDSGPVILQAAVPVQPGDTEEQLAARVLAQEHRIYPQAIRWFCEGRLRLGRNGAVTVDAARAPDGALIAPALEAR
jgi:phosphoribosylglycinamide formyltransferase-1